MKHCLLFAFTTHFHQTFVFYYVFPSTYTPLTVIFFTEKENYPDFDQSGSGRIGGNPVRSGWIENDTGLQSLYVVETNEHGFGSHRSSSSLRLPQPPSEGSGSTLNSVLRLRSHLRAYHRPL